MKVLCVIYTKDNAWNKLFIAKPAGILIILAAPLRGAYSPRIDVKIILQVRVIGICLIVI